MPANRNKKFEKAKDFKSAIKRLLKEQPGFSNMQIPIDTDEQKTMLRSLMNVQYLTQRRLMNIQSVRKSNGERLLNIRNMKKSPRI